MFKAVLLQFCASVFATLIAALVVGKQGAVSAALGGASVVIPNLLFAMRLGMVSRAKGAAHPATFLFGELAKVTLMVALLILTVRVYGDVHWLSLLGGLFLALQSNLFALLMKT